MNISKPLTICEKLVKSTAVYVYLND